jgi:hypothetical protein
MYFQIFNNKELTWLFFIEVEKKNSSVHNTVSQLDKQERETSHNWHTQKVKISASIPNL